MITDIQVTPRRIGTIRTVVGESPCWDADQNCLYLVDIIGRKLVRMDPETVEETIWEIPDFPTAVALSDDPNQLVLTCAGGVLLFDLVTGSLLPFAAPERANTDNRLNEAKPDPMGHLWVGSMQTNLNPDGTMRAMDRDAGAVFRLDGKGRHTQMTEADFGITNTMAWDRARGRFYVGDTLADSIYRYDVDDQTAALGPRSVHASQSGPGLPDGSALDRAGALWNCRYGGGCILQIDAEGDTVGRIDLPATNITDCTFGGPDLRTLYVTTAMNGLSQTTCAENPFEGSVMAFEMEVSGIPEAKVSL